MSWVSRSKLSAISYRTCAKSAASVSPRSVARVRMLCAKCFALCKLMSAPSGNGCVEPSIVSRKRAGTHHSAPRARRIDRSKARSASIVTRTALHLTCSSPATHASSSREFVSTCVRLPVAGSRLVDTAVRVLLWKGANAGAGACGVFMLSISVGLEISDEVIVLFFLFFVFTNAYESQIRFRVAS